MIKDLTYEELTQFCIYHTNVLKEECQGEELHALFHLLPLKLLIKYLNNNFVLYSRAVM